MNILLIFLLARLTLHLPLHGEQQKHTCSTDLDNYTEQHHSWNKLSPQTISNHVTEHTRTQPSENPAKKLRPNSTKTNGAIEMLHCSPKRCITIQQLPITPESSLCATPHTTHPPPPRLWPRAALHLNALTQASIYLSEALWCASFTCWTLAISLSLLSGSGSNSDTFLAAAWLIALSLYWRGTSSYDEGLFACVCELPRPFLCLAERIRAEHVWCCQVQNNTSFAHKQQAVW